MTWGQLAPSKTQRRRQMRLVGCALAVLLTGLETKWRESMRTKCLVGLLAVAVFGMVSTFCGPVAFAQAVYGSVLGTVTDPQGAAVAGAKITVINQRKSTT